MVARPVDDRDLHAYVDGCLDTQRRIEVEAWLAEDPASAERVNAYRSQIDQLHDLFDGVLRVLPAAQIPPIIIGGICRAKANQKTFVAARFAGA